MKLKNKMKPNQKIQIMRGFLLLRDSAGNSSKRGRQTIDQQLDFELV